MAVTVPLGTYIPAGCLYVDASSAVGTPLREYWPVSALPSRPSVGWLFSVHPDDAEDAPVSETPQDQHLLPPYQKILLQQPALAPLVRPFLKRWIRFSFRLSERHPEHGFCRVYVLPDDECRRLIPRSDLKLRRDVQIILSNLDYSAETWRHGEYDVNHQPLALHAVRAGGQDDDVWEGEESSAQKEMSLLEMFNNIPSPQPQPGLIQDESYQKVIDALATSHVRGLNSTLYGYQTRSAILMLQREVCPGRHIDPRLLCLSDQATGCPWYYDDVTGEVLRAPRWYEGISGGILAEEMGTGKTLICLALILATRAFPAEMPEVCRDVAYEDGTTGGGGGSGVRRKRIGSLADMAATVVTRQSIPWRLYLGNAESSLGEYRNCVDIIKRNPAQYVLPRFDLAARDEHCRTPQLHKKQQQEQQPQPVMPTITLSSCSLVIVPANLVRQWEQEIAKHTEGLHVIVVAGKQPLPGVADILEADILLFSIPRFERLEQDRIVTRHGWEFHSPLASVHFKRVIVDEGHRLGNSKIGRKSNLLHVLDCLHVSSRWIVTGTPSTGLFGVDEDATPSTPTANIGPMDDDNRTPYKHSKSSVFRTKATMFDSSKNLTESSSLQEKKDLERIGNMASLYLQVRPWANTLLEHNSGSDTLAEWAVYVMQPKHSNRSSGRRDCLRNTLNSLIIRHRKAEVGDLLPPVVENIVLLDGSYQDKLCLNLFSMMIIFNAVQSQRTDQDYFFHHSQRSALLQLLSNIRQSTFFGSYFYSAAEIVKALDTAEKFLVDRKVPISTEDEKLLQDAIAFGQLAKKNKFKQVADQFNEVPVYVQDFPGGGAFAAAWSIDEQGQEQVPPERTDRSTDGSLTCTAASMIRALQQFLRPCIDAPHSLQAMFNDGRFAARGHDVFLQQLEQQASSQPKGGSKSKATTPLAGNTTLGDDSGGSPLKKRSGALGTPARMDALPAPHDMPGTDIAAPLAQARIVSTASAKLSYLLGAIVQHQADEQILVFYDNENVAFYLAEHLEILQIHHLIYARGITAERRAQYVATFNNTSGIAHKNKFRVLLMDLSQAAFGLDMRSASRVYFLSPVLNPQVEAQAIGRVRRISQKKQVTVETLVLRDSLDEVIVARRQAMTQAEHRKLKSILDDRPIYEWMAHAKILPLPKLRESSDITGGEIDGPAQMAPLHMPQFLFGRGFGRVEHPDEGLVAVEERQQTRKAVSTAAESEIGDGSLAKRAVANIDGVGGSSSVEDDGGGAGPPAKKQKRPTGQVRFADIQL